MRKIALLILVIIISNSVFSQVSGYIGKKHEISYSINAFPNILPLDENFNNNISSQRDFLNRWNSFSYNYVITSKHKLGFSFDATSLKVFTPKTSSSLQDMFEGCGYNCNIEIINDIYTTKVKSFGIDFFQYHGDWIAPLGVYSRHSIKLLAFSVDTAEVNSLYNIGFVKDYETKGKSIGYYYSIGIEKILFNTLTLDIGTQLGLTTGMDINDVGETEPIEFVIFPAKKRVAYNYLLGVYLRLGIII